MQRDAARFSAVCVSERGVAVVQLVTPKENKVNSFCEASQWKPGVASLESTCLLESPPQARKVRQQLEDTHHSQLRHIEERLEPLRAHRRPSNASEAHRVAAGCTHLCHARRLSVPSRRIRYPFWREITRRTHAPVFSANPAQFMTLTLQRIPVPVERVVRGGGQTASRWAWCACLGPQRAHQCTTQCVTRGLSSHKADVERLPFTIPICILRRKCGSVEALAERSQCAASLVRERADSR